MSSLERMGEKLDFLYTAIVGIEKCYSHFDELAIGSLWVEYEHTVCDLAIMLLVLFGFFSFIHTLTLKYTM